MKIKDILLEGINDKGIFKAIFVTGLPGAGKSTIISKVNDGTVNAKIINTDRGYEFLLKKHSQSSSDIAWDLFGEPAQRINSNSLAAYLNGMLPLFIDGTSANPSSILRRNGALTSLGYDTMMLWVDTDLQTALDRIKQRESEGGRYVDEDFVIHVHEQLSKHKSYYQSQFHTFVEVNNSGSNFQNYEDAAYNEITKFFNSPIKNPIGVNTKQQMIDEQVKVLVPAIYDKNVIAKIVNMWY